MWVAFANAKATHILSAKVFVYKPWSKIYDTRASQQVASLSRFQLTETPTIFMPCFNICLNLRAKLHLYRVIHS